MIVDKTKSPMGKARPYLLLAGIPFAVLLVLVFSVPARDMQSKLVWAYATLILAGLFYSAAYVPFNAMVPLMTSDPIDKRRLGGLRAAAAAVGSIVVCGQTTGFVKRFGHGSEQAGFTMASTVIGVAGALAMVFVFLICRERPRADSPRSDDARQGLADMLRNPVWLVAAGFAFAMFLRLGALVSASLFFARDGLKYPAAAPFLLSSLSFSILIGSVAAPYVLARLGKKRANVLAITIALGLTVAQVMTRDRIGLFGLFYFFANITLGIQSATIFTLVADAVDAQEARFGGRHEGLLSSSASFAAKIGMAIGGALIAYGLGGAGYDSAAVNDHAREGVVRMYFGGPAAFAVLQLIIIGFYRPDMHRAPTRAIARNL